jgi:hypothetical protein
MNNHKSKILLPLALTFVVLLGMAAVSGCAPKGTDGETQGGTDGGGTTTAATGFETPMVNATSILQGDVATAADIDTYCLNCHLDSDLPSWNKNNIDAAMVESMNPMLSEGDLDAIAAYFATIEPQEQPH